MSATVAVTKPTSPTSPLPHAARRDRASVSLWARLSTWALLLLLLYFALDGVSPFVNEPTATRAVATSSAGGVLVDRASKLVIFAFCITLALQQRQLVLQLSARSKLITAFPLLAILLSPISQLPSRTISSGVLLLGAVFLVNYIVARYTINEALELLLVLGSATMLASILFALALPQYGLDQMGGHSTAWKGIFSAKNYLGNVALFFLTVAVSYSARSRWWQSLRFLQILACLTAIAFSRAATAYILTAFYLLFLAVLKTLHGLRKRDYLVACLLLIVVLSLAVFVTVVWPDLLLNLLGKDNTFTGRTGIWSAVLDSIAKRPLLGYGYQAFWLGLEGESYRVILEVSWMLAQAQSGFLDILLQMGLAGLSVVSLIFGFAFRDAAICLLRSHDRTQLRAVEWYLTIVLLTLLYNLDESFLFEPKHLGSLMFVLACVGLKKEWMGKEPTCA
jgi:exopolysaccharide production protein ExoQ